MRAVPARSCTVPPFVGTLVGNQPQTEGRPMRARRLLAPLLLLALTPATAPAQPKVGDEPPPIGLEETLRTPADATLSWDALRGKVVVLEFWATWCGPCVAAFPHLNKLVDEMAGEDVLFLSVTDEPRERVEPFLAKRELKTWVGLDTDGSMMKAYGVRAIPRTVLVGKDGRIAAITYPTMVSAAALRSLLNGEPLPIGAEEPEAARSFVIGGELPNEEPGEHAGRTLRLIIRPSSGGGMVATNNSGITAESWTVRNAVAAAMDVPTSRVSMPDGFDVADQEDGDDKAAENRYLFVALAPQGAGGWRPILRWGISERFGLDLARETAERDVWVLTVHADGAKLTEADPAAGGQWRTTGDMIDATGASIGTLAEWLERRLDSPVLDETNLKEPFDYRFDAEPESTPDQIAAALRERLGLRLERQRRPVEVVRVTRRAPAEARGGD